MFISHQVRRWGSSTQMNVLKLMVGTTGGGRMQRICPPSPFRQFSQEQPREAEQGMFGFYQQYSRLALRSKPSNTGSAGSPVRAGGAFARPRIQKERFTGAPAGRAPHTLCSHLSSTSNPPRGARLPFGCHFSAQPTTAIVQREFSWEGLLHY